MTIRNRRMVGVLLSLCIGGCGVKKGTDGAGTGAVDVSSPNGSVQMEVKSGGDGRLMYHVTLNGQAVIEESPVGIVVDGKNLGEGARIVREETYGVDESYPTRGVHSTAVDRCNGMKIDLASGGTQWQLDVRAYDSGVAFRYVVPGDGKRVPDEATSYKIPAGSTAWVQSVRGHYEDIPMKTPIGAIKKDQFAAPPLTIELPEHHGFASITEAAVYHYAGSALQVDGERSFAVRLAPRVTPSYPFTLRYGEAGDKRITTPMPIDGPINSPWRVVLVGPDLNTLVNSDILTNLNPAPDKALFPEGQATDWIKPGRAVWCYLDGGRDNSPEGAKEFAQLGSVLDFQYNVIEGYWGRWSDDELRDVVNYSKARGMGVWVWMTSDPAREVRRAQATTATRGARRPATAPANLPETPGGPGLEPWPAARNAAAGGPPPERSGPDTRPDLRNSDVRRKLFAHLHGIGVAGVKIDFIDTEAQEAEEFYEGTLKDAAEFHILVDFHGSAKPTGEQRTYPNEMTREAIFGMEHRAYPAGSSAAEAHTVLPFARFLAGSGDYTPVIFGVRRYNTTWTHQVATAVVFTSALQTYSAHPGNILKTPAAGMIETIPSVWDETRVLPDSQIGEIAAYARRSGNAWFIGVVNGETPRDMTIDLSFLGDGQYKVDSLNDVPDNNAAINTDTKTLSRTDTISLHLGTGGGFVAHFTKQ
jgi:alpha-glucosidase